MDKKGLLKKFEEQIAASLATITQSALEAHSAATHPESKSEDQYDTRGLEASYLAGAQSKRVMELEELLAMYRYIDLANFDESSPIAATAVIELDFLEKRSFYLLMPKGGGMTAMIDGKPVQTITPVSPLGSNLLGKRVGDQISVEIQKAVRDYDIVSVC